MKFTIDDWKFFGRTYVFFQLFASFMFVEKNKKSLISQVFNAMDVFLKHYEQKKIILILKLKTAKCCIQSI